MKLQTICYSLSLSLGLLLGSGSVLPMQAYSAENTSQKAPLMIQEQGSFMAGGSAVQAKEAYNPLRQPRKARLCMATMPMSITKFLFMPKNILWHFCTVQGSFPVHGKQPQADVRAFNIFSCAKATACI